MMENKASQPNTFAQFAKDPILHKYDGRCGECYMREEMCFCAELKPIANFNPLTVIMHTRESYKTTNTARVACMVLQNSQIFLRGQKEKPLVLPDLNSHTKNNEILHYEPLLLTLSDESKTLTQELIESFTKPVHLIVPDGNWRQASRMRNREPALKKITWVKLPPGPQSSYRLRHEHHPEGLSTLEAIARAYRIIEGAHIEEELIRIFNIMVERTLKTRPPRST